MSFKLSICIPTFNRPSQLPNCLNSICIAKANSNLDFDVCISDNNSNYDVKKIIDNFSDKLKINLNINKKFRLSTNLAKLFRYQIASLFGLEMTIFLHQISKLLNELFEKYKDIDFYYINSFHLNYIT